MLGSAILLEETPFNNDKTKVHTELRYVKSQTYLQRFMRLSTHNAAILTSRHLPLDESIPQFTFHEGNFLSKIKITLRVRVRVAHFRAPHASPRNNKPLASVC